MPRQRLFELAWGQPKRFVMLRIHQTLLAIVAMCVLAGCQATSTSAPYKPANCAMVGSSCGRTHHFF
jgi:hypothetical protein